METIKVSKKALRSLLTDSMREAIGSLQLPKPTKRVDRLLEKSSKKLAAEFAHILKKSSRRAKEEEKSAEYVEGVLKGKKGKKAKAKAIQEV